MRENIIKLREIMKKNNIDAFIAPSLDAHQSEYVSEYDKCREYLSGFSGSAGTLLVFMDSAYLWTDGRYFIQAKKELEGSGIELMRQGESDVLDIYDFLAENIKRNSRLCIQGKLFDISSGKRLKKISEDLELDFITDMDLVDMIWKDRPKKNANPIWIHDDIYSGKSFTKKLECMREKLSSTAADAMLITSLSDIAWITNLRGSDIECNPLFLSYMFISSDDVKLFIQKEAVDEKIKRYLEINSIKLYVYNDWFDYIRKLRGLRLLVDAMGCDYMTYIEIKDKNTVFTVYNLVADKKIIKNSIEIDNMKKAHIRDGVYITKFMYWLRKELKSGNKVTEKTAADYMDKLRAGDEKYISKSFNTISGYAKNAAICHYDVKEESALTLENKGLYLIDSGAHYLDGTTDITRTMALGELSDDERLHYTLVLKGMLKFLYAKFPKGTKGYNLDVYARSSMWEYGFNFNHGTGHGVGFCNTVHEGPISIRTKANGIKDLDIEEGMIFSDEPGLYIENSHGIRIENLVFVKEEKDGFLSLEALTYAPIDPRAVDISIMTNEDIERYNNYQREVYEKLSLFLKQDEKNWLYDETKGLLK